MTDTPSSPTDPVDDDLLASLYLDGEATADERAQVEADPQLLARVRSFEAMAADLASVTPPPELARLQISAALDLFDEQQAPSTASTGTPGPTSGVTSLSERRDQKQSRGLPTWLSAAAALVLVVGGLGFVSTLGGGDDDSAASDVAMDDETDASESGASRVIEDTETSMAAAEIASDGAAEAMEDEVMDDEAMDDETADADAMEESSSDDGDEAGAPPSPIPLDELEAASAEEYLSLLIDQRLRPIEDSPCAGSPLVDGLFGVDSFIEVVYRGELSSLLVQEGVPSTAVIVGPTCEIALR